MKKLAKLILSTILIVVASVAFVGCKDKEKDVVITTVGGGTNVYGALVGTWREGDNAEMYLSTSVNINCDTISISNISKITFQLYNDDILLGTAISEGANLVRLVQNHKEESNLEELTGEQTLNCQFKADSSGYDDGMWVRSDCVGTAVDLPDKLVVRVLVGSTEYLTTYNREA